MKKYGPQIPISEEIHAMKYRSEGESFEDACYRQSSVLSDNDQHRHALTEILLEQRFMPGGRVQATIGSPRQTTPYNCFVSGSIEDSFDGIMHRATEAGRTMRLGGGIGYDFSTLRPRGELIKTLGSKSSGPVSFMSIFDAICGTVASSGHRRGAQMGVIRVDHPDIQEFIHAKRNSTALRNFNISVGITDEFMNAVLHNEMFTLKWGDKEFGSVNAKALWEDIMRSTWDWAEPGVLFIDRIQLMNNLWYCETISATNPCGEQPLPPFGACLLGSFNLVKYLVETPFGFAFDYDKFKDDIPHVVRAMDNVVDSAIYPLDPQAEEARSKRRMGLGITGLANCLEVMGHSYGSQGFLIALEGILTVLRDETYRASINLAKEKGAFPLFDKSNYSAGAFIETLPEDIQDDIFLCGIRNSHLLSIAPTGTISLSADNVSSGIEPVFTHEYVRTIQTFDGPIEEKVQDWAYREMGLKGKTSSQVSVQEHVAVLTLCQQYIDSAVSKTCNVGEDVTWEEFQNIYIDAWRGGAKGCTTFRAAGKRYGILNEVKEADKEGQACYIDPVTGKKSCD